jgi:hypothetical protein
MNSIIQRVLLGTAVCIGVAAPIALASTAADAAPAGRNVTASTHIAGVPDTTVGTTATGAYEDASGHVTHDQALSVYGPVWAIDEITNTFRVTPLGNNDYRVDRIANGTYEGFAQPNTGLSYPMPLDNVSGQLHGTNSYLVHSLQAPNAANLPSEQVLPATGNQFPGTYAQLYQLFGSDAVITGGNTWVFAYVADGGGSRMVQRYDTTSDTWGNITG